MIGWGGAGWVLGWRGAGCWGGEYHSLAKYTTERSKKNHYVIDIIGSMTWEGKCGQNLFAAADQYCAI